MEKETPKKKRSLVIDTIKANDPSMRCRNCIFFIGSPHPGNRFGFCPRKHRTTYTEYGCQNEFLAKKIPLKF